MDWGSSATRNTEEKAVQGNLERAGLMGFLEGPGFSCPAAWREQRDRFDKISRWGQANKFILGLTEEKAMEIMQNH